MNLPTEASIIFAAVSTGFALALKAVKWGRDLFAPKNSWDGLERRDAQRLGVKYLSVEEHSAMCALQSRPISEAFSEIKTALIEANKTRVLEVQRLFDKMDKNNAILLDKIGGHAERIATLEARR